MSAPEFESLPHVLIGPPVSRRKQRRLGIARFIPGIGYQKRTCQRCRDHLWLGPRQLAKLEAEPGAGIVCRVCIWPELIAGLKDGTLAYGHLGGAAAGRQRQGGNLEDRLRNQLI